MSRPVHSYRIFPLGDSAVTIDFGNEINESINNRALSLFQQLTSDPLPAMIEAVPAYSSLTVYYDLYAASKMSNDRTAYELVSELLNQRLSGSSAGEGGQSRLLKIPVCYEKEFAPDIEWLAKEKHLPVDELVRIHSSQQYRVYMLGFLPGFSYLGELDERISAPRKTQPVMVAAGSIGIAGKQTGIYPSASPGGWQIIGRTPLKLFDASREEPTLLKAGDIVQFISIGNNEFANY